jgi:hypothetical protein
MYSAESLLIDGLCGSYFNKLDCAIASGFPTSREQMQFNSLTELLWLCNHGQHDLLPFLVK